jgi:multidrug resistance efflux pump
MKRVNLRNYPFRLRLHFFPVLVWLCALICVIFLFSRRSQRFEVIGITQGQVSQLATNSPGRVVSVNVRQFDSVTEGQTLAVVNTVLDNEQLRSELQAQLATVLAEIQHLTSQLVPTQNSLLADEYDRENTRISDSRRFSVDVENARLEILRLKALIETDRISLEDLALEVQISQELVEQQVVTPYDLQKSQAQYDTMLKKIEENENLLAQAESALEEAQKRKEEYLQFQPHNPSVEDALEVIRAAIRVEERRMDEVLKQIESLDLREAVELKAPFDGIVSQVLRQSSEAVLAGEAILVITNTEPENIVAYTNEEFINLIQEESTVELIKMSDPARITRSKVIYIGPTVEQLPARLWQNPNVPQWGRPFLIEAPLGMELTVGEAVGIRRL